MEKNDGMVAVVHGLRDSNLTVTLLDGGKQYTLMPNDSAPQPNAVQLRCLPSVDCASQYISHECPGSTTGRNKDNSIQATDGTYASTYKMMHCNLSPTSPPPTVTEFPPQKPKVLHGHGNFVVGGHGSGETGRPAVTTNSFRGGLVWPDKGSVCTSRGSVQSDAFAKSLRKYPNISPERSNEILERLINFTQAKNSSKNQNRCSSSPTRNSVESKSSKQMFVFEPNSSKNFAMSKALYYPEVSSNNNRMQENSPVRERSENFLLKENEDPWTRPLFCKSNDIRCVRDTARNVKQGFRDLVATQPTSECHKSSSSRLREQYDCEVYQHRIYKQESKNSVNMEIQAAAQMESKEMITLPRLVPMQRTIATSLSPIPSKTEGRKEEGYAFSSSTNIRHASSCKSIQVKLPPGTSIIKSSSSFDLRNNKYRNEIKRSRSQEELGNIKKRIIDDTICLQQQFKNTSDIDEASSHVEGPPYKMKKICQHCKHIFDDFDILRRSFSNNTYFKEDFRFNINQQHTSKHFKEMPSDDHPDDNDLVNNDKYNNLQEQIVKPPVLLSHLYNSNNIKIIDLDCKDISVFRKASKESHTIKYDCNTAEELKNKIVEQKIKWIESKCNFDRTDRSNSEEFEGELKYTNRILAMTEEEIRNLIDLDILAFTEKFRINITTESLYNLSEELFDVFIMDLKNSKCPNKKIMSEKIKKLLHNTGLSELQSKYLTNILTEHWEEEFLTTNNLIFNPSNFKSETIIVLPNITQDLVQYEQNDDKPNNDRDFSINEISQKDIDANVKLYTSQIINEIDEWLFYIDMRCTKGKEIRQAVINDLATDIIDRQKYLEFNPTCDSSETSELEHLKYQIFKLIHRHAISDMTLVDRAIDLLRRIQSIAVPIFSIQERKLITRKISYPDTETNQYYQKLNVTEPSNLGASSSRQINSSGSKCCKRATCKINVNNDAMSEYNSGKNISLREPRRNNQGATSTRRMSSPAKLVSTNTEYNRMGGMSQPLVKQSETQQSKIDEPFKQYQSLRNTSSNNISYNKSVLPSGGIKILDEENCNNKNHTNFQIRQSNLDEVIEEYNKYLKEWIEQIPLPMKTVEDQTLTKIFKTDIYNAILETISKLRSDPNTFNNRFLFEDILDEEIEKLINNLPQSPELTSKKHVLKVKLIEKTSDTNDLMKSSEKSYKQQLVQNLRDNLPKPTPSETENPDILEIYEELQILNLVEDFIICSCYQDQDTIIAEAYRKKLVQRTENFVEELKANHNKALKNIDPRLYLKNILDTLKNVSLPSDETIQKEANEILLSIEIDKWISDLPMVQNNDYVEQLHRRRLRNNLAKQILDIEKGDEVNLSDDSLKHEISQFLGKAPLRLGESLNINYMVDELVKRLKIRPISIGNDGKKVGFNEPNYEEFSKNIPLCSTYTGDPSQNIENQDRFEMSAKSIQAIGPSQPQWHSGHYHNISKPLFDDINLDQNYCNTDLSLQETPKYEMFENNRPRSSSMKVEPHWYTLQESKQENQQSNISLNNRHRNKTEQSNKSIQACIPSVQSHNRHYHNIAKPLLDDFRLDSNCCNDDIKDVSTGNDFPSKTSFLKNGSEPNWYTLQESNHSNKLQSTNESSRFIPYNGNTSRRLDEKGQEQNGRSGQDFIVPEHYLENGDLDNYAAQQSHDVSYLSRNNSPKRGMLRSTEEDIKRRINNYTLEQRTPNLHSPAEVSQNRRDSSGINQQRIGLEQITSPHRTTYHPTFPKEPNKNISNRSPGIQNIIKEQRSGSPQLNRSDLFYRSTDQDGIKQTIERNKSMEANLDKYNFDHLSGYYQPPVLIPARRHVPFKPRTKKDNYMTESYIDGQFEEKEEEEDSDEDNDETDGIRCRCVEKMWKSKRRYRYCPFEQYDGFPMCLNSPYFYPYFY